MEEEQQTWICFWCGGDASLTNDGSMHSELYDKVICAKCLDKHNWLLIMFHRGLRPDGRQSAYQLQLL